MKKILQAFDGASEKKPVAGANDMKKFLSIIKEGVAAQTTQEAVISSFEAGSIGGDANDFLLAADKIQDEVMAQVNRIKINADEALLRDMMDKFNSFMTSYHAVGKDILQPDMFNDSMGESTDDQVDEAGYYRRPGRPDAYDRDYASSISGMGKKDSLAYQMDGGANDEGWDDEEPRSYNKPRYQAPQDKPKMVGMFFYDVKPGQEDEAAILGIKQTKSGKWAKTKYSTSGRTFSFQKNKADEKFGLGKWWAPKNESVTEMDKSQTPPGRDGGSSGGKEYRGKPLTAKQMMDKAHKTMMKSMSNAEKVDKGWRNPNKKDESVAEGLSFKDYVNLAESKKGLE